MMMLRFQAVDYKRELKKKFKEKLQGIDQCPIDDPLISITESQRLSLRCS
jgi:hypothetical protein